MKITKAELPWQMLARAWLPNEVAMQRRAELLALCSGMDYAACVPFGREPGAVGVLLRAGAAAAPDAAWLARVEALLGLDLPDVLRYTDPRRGQSRSVRLVAHEVDGQAAGARLKAFLLAGDIQAAEWVSALLMDDLPAQSYGRALLAGTKVPPVAVPSRGVQVCNCFDVTEPEIAAMLARCSGSADARLAQLQATLKCGTNCGSCLPALRQQVQRVQPAAQAA